MSKRSTASNLWAAVTFDTIWMIFVTQNDFRVQAHLTVLAAFDNNFRWKSLKIPFALHFYVDEIFFDWICAAFSENGSFISLHLTGAHSDTDSIQRMKCHQVSNADMNVLYRYATCLRNTYPYTEEASIIGEEITTNKFKYVNAHAVDGVDVPNSFNMRMSQRCQLTLSYARQSNLKRLLLYTSLWHLNRDVSNSRRLQIHVRRIQNTIFCCGYGTSIKTWKIFPVTSCHTDNILDGPRENESMSNNELKIHFRNE